MAIGFPASYTEVIRTVGSRSDTRASVTGVFEALGWDYEATGSDLYEVRMPGSLSDWGATLTVSVTDERTVIVTSESVFFQIFDWGQNKRNVRQFTAVFSPREVREALLGLNEPAYIDETGQTPVDRMLSTNESESMTKKE